MVNEGTVSYLFFHGFHRQFWFIFISPLYFITTNIVNRLAFIQCSSQFPHISFIQKSKQKRNCILRRGAWTHKMKDEKKLIQSAFESFLFISPFFQLFCCQFNTFWSIMNCVFKKNMQWNTKRWSVMQINGVVGIALCLEQQPLFYRQAHKKSQRTYVSMCVPFRTGVY